MAEAALTIPTKWLWRTAVLLGCACLVGGASFAVYAFGPALVEKFKSPPVVQAPIQFPERKIVFEDHSELGCEVDGVHSRDVQIWDSGPAIWHDVATGGDFRIGYPREVHRLRTPVGKEAKAAE